MDTHRILATQQYGTGLPLECPMRYGYERSQTTANRICGKSASGVASEKIARGYAAEDIVERVLGTIRLVQSAGPTGHGQRANRSPPFLSRFAEITRHLCVGVC